MPLERQYSKQKKETGAGMPLGLQVFTSPDSNQLDKKWQSSTLEASWHLLNLWTDEQRNLQLSAMSSMKWRVKFCQSKQYEQTA